MEYSSLVCWAAIRKESKEIKLNVEWNWKSINDGPEYSTIIIVSSFRTWIAYSNVILPRSQFFLFPPFFVCVSCVQLYAVQRCCFKFCWYFLHRRLDKKSMKSAQVSTQLKQLRNSLVVSTNLFWSLIHRSNRFIQRFYVLHRSILVGSNQSFNTIILLIVYIKFYNRFYLTVVLLKYQASFLRKTNHLTSALNTALSLILNHHRLKYIVRLRILFPTDANINIA